MTKNNYEIVIDVGQHYPGETIEKLEEKLRGLIADQGMSAKIHTSAALTGNDLSVPSDQIEREQYRPRCRG